jgi:putrescine transport system permease protein
MALVFLFLYLPLLFMMLFSFNSTRQDAQLHRFFAALVRGADQRHQDRRRLLAVAEVATVTGVLSAVLGTFAAFVLVRYRRFTGRTLFSGMVNAPLVMPEVVIGLSLLLLMVGAQNAFGWPSVAC